MTLKTVALGMSIALIGGFSFVGVSIDTSVPGWVTLQEAKAQMYRRGARRTARRTSRRTSYRHGGYGYYGGGAVAGAAVVTAIAVGTMVATLPPSCTAMVVNGVTYQNCAGTYYVPSSSQWVIVEAP